MKYKSKWRGIGFFVGGALCELFSIKNPNDPQLILALLGLLLICIGAVGQLSRRVDWID